MSNLQPGPTLCKVEPRIAQPQIPQNANQTGARVGHKSCRTNPSRPFDMMHENSHHVNCDRALGICRRYSVNLLVTLWSEVRAKVVSSSGYEVKRAFTHMGG